MARRKVQSAAMADDLRRTVRLVLMEMNAALASDPKPDLLFEAVAMYDMVSRWRADLRASMNRLDMDLKKRPLATDP